MMPTSHKSDSYLDDFGRPSNALLAYTGGSQTNAFGVQSLVAFAYIFELLHKSRRMVERQRFTRSLSIVERIRLFLSRHRRYRQVKARLGVDLPIPFERIDDLVVEVERHRWLEAEKAGRDIWSERNPADPEGSALRHWFENHFATWHAHHIARRQPLPC